MSRLGERERLGRLRRWSAQQLLPAGSQVSFLVIFSWDLFGYVFGIGVSV